jgi:hypothetical protein
MNKYSWDVDLRGFFSVPGAPASLGPALYSPYTLHSFPLSLFHIFISYCPIFFSYFYNSSDYRTCPCYLLPFGSSYPSLQNMKIQESNDITSRDTCYVTGTFTVKSACVWVVCRQASVAAIHVRWQQSFVGRLASYGCSALLFSFLPMIVWILFLALRIYACNVHLDRVSF